MNSGEMPRRKLSSTAAYSIILILLQQQPATAVWIGIPRVAGGQDVHGGEGTLFTWRPGDRTSAA